MRRRYGERLHENSTVTEDQADPSLGRLAGAVNELSGLAGVRPSIAIERLLTELDNATECTSEKIEAVHQLRVWRADCLKLTAELDAVARSFHLIDQGLGRRIDAVLAEWERRFEVTAPRAAEHPAAAVRRGLFRGLRRRRDAQAPLARVLEDAAQRQWEPSPGVPLAQELACPLAEAYDADIVARVLGPMDLSVAGAHVLRWGSLKARAIFQYLLIHQDRPVRREVLMELGWPDHSHNSARNNLNVALHSLRNTLDQKGMVPRTIVHKEGCYLLNPALTCWIDRNEFLSQINSARRARREGSTQTAVDACRSAVRLYHGPLFEDDLAGEWYLAERRQLKELNLQALEYLAETYCDRDQLSTAVEFGQCAISIDPCYEAAHRLLMRCYSRQHQQQLVSRQYQLCAAALRDELDVSPDAETIRLLHSLTSTA